MNLSRRKFLKLTALGFASVAVPAIAKEPELTPIQGFIPQVPTKVGYTITNLEKGDYWVSYSFKKNGDTVWMRYSETITIENDGDSCDVEYELSKGDSIKCVQFERSKQSSGYVTNLVPDCSGLKIKDGAVTIDSDDLGFSFYHCV